jgi:hypothetical protein
VLQFRSPARIQLLSKIIVIKIKTTLSKEHYYEN